MPALAAPAPPKATTPEEDLISLGLSPDAPTGDAPDWASGDPTQATAAPQTDPEVDLLKVGGVEGPEREDIIKRHFVDNPEFNPKIASVLRKKELGEKAKDDPLVKAYDDANRQRVDITAQDKSFDPASHYFHFQQAPLLQDDSGLDPRLVAEAEMDFAKEVYRKQNRDRKDFDWGKVKEQLKEGAGDAFGLLGAARGAGYLAQDVYQGTKGLLNKGENYVSPEDEAAGELARRELKGSALRTGGAILDMAIGAKRMLERTRLQPNPQTGLLETVPAPPLSDKELDERLQNDVRLGPELRARTAKGTDLPTMWDANPATNAELEHEAGGARTAWAQDLHVKPNATGTGLEFGASDEQKKLPAGEARMGDMSNAEMFTVLEPLFSNPASREVAARSLQAAGWSAEKLAALTPTALGALVHRLHLGPIGHVAKGLYKLAAEKVGPEVAEEAATNSAADAVKGVRKNILTEAGNELLDPARGPELPDGAIRTTLKDLAKETATNVAGNAPFIALSDKPEDAVSPMLGFALLGAAKAPFHGIHEAVTRTQRNLGASNMLERIGSKVQYGLGQDDAHAEGMALLSPEDQATVNRWRGFTNRARPNGAPHQIYVLTPEDFVARFGQNARGAEVDGTAVYLNAGLADRGVQGTAGHEFGHSIDKAIADEMMPEIAKSLRDSMAKALYVDGKPTPEFQDFAKGYSEKHGQNFDLNDPDQRTYMEGEFLAESTRNATQKKSLGEFAMPESMKSRLNQGFQNFLQKMGVNVPPDKMSEFNWTEAPTVTRHLEEILRGIGKNAVDPKATDPAISAATRIRQIDASLGEIQAMDPAKVTPEVLGQRQKLAKERAGLQEQLDAMNGPSAAPSSPVAPSGGQTPPKTPQNGPDRAGVAQALVAMGIGQKEARQWAEVAEGDNLEEMVSDALAARMEKRNPRQQPQVGQPTPVTPATPATPAATPGAPLAAVEPSAPQSAAEPLGNVAVAEEPKPATAQVTQNNEKPAPNPTPSGETPVPSAQDNRLPHDAPTPPAVPAVPASDQVEIARAAAPEGSPLRKTIDTLDANRGKVVWVKDYHAAERKQEGFSEAERSEEIRKQSAKKRKAGAQGTLQDKPFIPTEIRVNAKGEPYANGFDVDVLLSNLRHVSDAMKEAGIDNPLKPKAGEVNPDGTPVTEDQKVQAALKGYIENQMHGNAGAGDRPLNQPGGDYRMAPPDEAHPPQPLHEDSKTAQTISDMLNMAANAKPHEVSAGEADKAVALAIENDGHRVLSSVGVETNALRDQLRKAGMDIDGTLSKRSAFYGRLSPELMKGGVTTEPITHGEGGKTVRPHGYDIDLQRAFEAGKPQFEAVVAGFMPDTGPLSKVDSDPIKEAAVKLPDGRVITGPSHPQISDDIQTFHDQYKVTPQQYGDWEQAGKIVDGFVTQNGKFLTRGEAHDHALSQGQISEEAPFKRLETDSFAKDRQFMPDTGKAPLRNVRSDQDELGFYSGLARTAEQKLPAKGRGDQFLGILENAGAKKEEVETMGLKEFLQSKPSATKQEVVDFIKAGGIQLKEVTKGEIPAAKKTLVLERMKDLSLDGKTDFSGAEATHKNRSDYEDLIQEAADEVKRGDYDNAIASLEAADDIEREFVASGEKTEARLIIDELHDVGATKYDQYQIPGGKNYREVVLTLPVDARPPKNLKAEYKGGGEYDILGDEGIRRGTVRAKSPEEAVGAWWQNSAARKMAVQGKSFHSSHFPEEGYLAHMRQGDHADTEGNKVRVMEEFQSDLHQEGRKKGYRKPLSTDEKSRLEELSAEFKKAMLDPDGSMDQVKKDEYYALKSRAEGLTGVPDAPFKKNWHELLFKRALRSAIEDGMDKIAWTQGKDQIDRYEDDFRKNVDKITWTDHGDTHEVVAWKDGQPIFNGEFNQDGRSTHPIAGEPRDMSEVVGKNIASQIMEGTGHAQGVNEATWEGKDLSIGGEGMKGFYDKILPDFVRKYVKKWGGTVETTEIPGAESDNKYIKDYDAFREFIDPDGHVSEEEFNGMSNAEKWAMIPDPGTVTVHSVTITPEMRAAILEEGQPMFMPDTGKKAKGKKKPLEGVDFIPHGDPRRDKNFQKWAGKDTPIVTMEDDAHAIPSGQPVVVEAVHGTTHSYDVADPTRGNPENDLGKGWYASNTPEDTGANYAGEGPDLTQRIELRGERLHDEIGNNFEGDPEAVADRYDISEDDAKLILGEYPKYSSPEYNHLQNVLKDLAKREIKGEHDGASMKVFIKFEKPLKLGGEGEERWDAYDEDHNPDDENAEPTGKLIRFANFIRSEAEAYGGASEFDAFEHDGEKVSKIIQAAKESISDAYDNDHPENPSMGPEIVRRAIEDLGYDGIIDATVNEKFGYKRGERKGMAGMDENTVHYIAFHPEQIKSATGNKGTFDPKSPNMNLMPDTPEFNRWSEGLPVLDGTEGEMPWRGGFVFRGHHGTSKSRGEFDIFENGRTSADFLKLNFDGLGPGWFSSNPEQAGRFGDRVIDAYVKLKKPLVLSADPLAQEKYMDELAEYREKNKAFEEDTKGYWTPKDWKRFEALKKQFKGDKAAVHESDPFARLTALAKEAAIEFPNVSKGEAIRLALKEQGYDGIVLDGTSADTKASDKQRNVWAIPFDGGAQIKSATGNSGAFDPNNPSMNFMPDTKGDQNLPLRKVRSEENEMTPEKVGSIDITPKMGKRDFALMPETRPDKDGRIWGGWRKGKVAKGYVDKEGKVITWPYSPENGWPMHQDIYKEMEVNPRDVLARFDVNKDGRIELDPNDELPAEKVGEIGNSILSHDQRFSLMPDTGTPAFKKWFGDSKVVDKKGEPRIIYHGAPDVRGIFKEGFKAFSRGKVFFGTDDYQAADTYTDPHRAFDYQSAEDGVIPLYVSMQNPMEIDAGGKFWKETEKAVNAAKEAGHDGIIIRNSVDHYFNSDQTKPHTVYAWFEPTQAKSALGKQMKSRVDGQPIPEAGPNNGNFDPEDPRISYMPDTPPPVPPPKDYKPVPRSSVKYFVGPPPTLQGTSGKGNKVGLNDVARHLTRENQKAGRLADRTSENARKIAALADETKYALAQDKSAIGWYDAKVKEAFKTIQKVHPELAHDKDAMSLYKAFTAITSNGQNVYDNFKRADELYEYWKDHGTIEVDGIFGGKTKPVINKSLRFLQSLINDRGLDGMRAFLEEPAQVRDLNKSGLKIGGEQADTMLKGSAVLGPKIGSFYGNLNGDFSSVTMDRWFMRTYNRLNGTLTDPLVSRIKPNVERFMEAMRGLQIDPETKHKLGPIREELRKLMKSAENGTLDIEKIQDSTEDWMKYLKERYNLFSSGGFKDRSEINRATKNLYEAINKIREAPQNGRERTWIRNVMAETQKLLQAGGVQISNADLQALLWYYEKNLYARLGFRPKKAAPADYALAAQAVLEAHQSRGAKPRGRSGSAGAQPLTGVDEPVPNRGRRKKTAATLAEVE